MPAVRIDPDLTEEVFIPVFLDEHFTECVLALAGSATVSEYEPGTWSVSAEVLNTEGQTERRVLGESFDRYSEARGQADHINGLLEASL